MTPYIKKLQIKQQPVFEFVFKGSLNNLCKQENNVISLPNQLILSNIDDMHSALFWKLINQMAGQSNLAYVQFAPTPYSLPCANLLFNPPLVSQCICSNINVQLQKWRCIMTTRTSGQPYDPFGYFNLTKTEKEQRETLYKERLEVEIEYFIDGGRNNLSYVFFKSLYRVGILDYLEYKNYQIKDQVKAKASQEQLLKIKEYEDSVYERLTTELIRIFPEFKKKKNLSGGPLQ